MNLITLDFESYYDSDFTLKKLTTEEYVRDPRFDVIGVGIKVDTQPAQWFAGADATHALGSLPWETSIACAHHAHFDGLILSHHFGIKPYQWLDTLSMARALHGTEVGGSLAKLAEKYGIGQKGHEVQDAKGKRLQDFTAAELEAYGRYCINDVELTFKLLQHLLTARGLLPTRFPFTELDLIDLTVKFFTDPVLQLDTARLRDFEKHEAERREELFARVGLTAADLRKKDVVEQALRARGVEPPMKQDKKGKWVLACAKTDKEFTALADHEDEVVQAIVAARLGAASSINHTRAARMLAMSERGPMPVYLNYYGAHTGRWSGSDKLNLQNLPRGGELRKAIVAPKGYVIAVADSSQIEARTLAVLAGQRDLVDAFAQGRDVYSEFATRLYERPITKADKIARHVGKCMTLGLGYGMGPVKFRESMAAGMLGGPKLTFSEDESKAIVVMYRTANPAIVEYWRQAQMILGRLYAGDSDFAWGPFRIWGQSLMLPNGMALHFPDLQYDGKEFSYQGREGRVKLYGGKLVENLTQSAARIIVSDQIRIIAQRYRVVSMTHDEVLALVPEPEADAGLAWMIEVMRSRPAWAPDLPLDAEGGYAQEYSK